jgi:hypothetical protein
MAKQDFLPKDKSGYVQWHDTFKTGVTELGTELGATADEVTAVGTRNTELHGKRTNTETKAAAAKQATGEEDAVIKTSQATDRTLAKKFKLSPNYTEAKGKRLGIVGSEDTTALTEPTLTGESKANGRVELGFPKGKSKGVNSYSKRGTETAYTFLARDTEAPYMDTRALLVPGQPETRTFRATYVGPGDEEVGEPGNELTITARP